LYQSGEDSKTIVVIASTKKKITNIVSKMSRWVNISSKVVFLIESFLKIFRESRFPRIPIKPITLKVKPSTQNLK
jgi:hypothetical protein